MDEQYELPNGKTLYRWTDQFGDQWACAADGHAPLCRCCQRVDGTLEACLQHVVDGLFELRQDPNTAEFQFKTTPEGKRQAAKLIQELGPHAS